MSSHRAQRLAIIGAGPMCVYALERLAAHIEQSRHPIALSIEIFERSGNFGDGEVNSRAQPASSLMNRITAQVGFAADESHLPDLPLLPKQLRPSLYEWLEQHRTECTAPDQGLSPGTIAARRWHGLALAHQFQQYVALLRTAGVRVTLHTAEVIDVCADTQSAALELHTTAAQVRRVAVDHALFVTGNAASFARPHRRCTGSTREPCIIPYAYPLDRQLTLECVPPGEPVGLAGLGLTAIDAALYLTEGRGGRFERIADPDRPIPQYRYIPSLLEPSVIVAFSPSGVLPCSRAENAKLTDPRLSYTGRYFTKAAILRLRQSRGTPAALPNGQLIAQLDFDADVLPLVILELTRAYYTALFGMDFSTRVAAAVEAPYEAVFDKRGPRGMAAIESLLNPIEPCVEEAFASIEGRTLTRLPVLTQTNIAEAFRSVVYGHAHGHLETGPHAVGIQPHSPWDHPADPREHRLNWKRLLYPPRPEQPLQPHDWVQQLKACMRRDLMDSHQNNLRNPVKVACDGVLRDLRGVFCEMVDGGGLTPTSHKAFLSGFMRCYHRVSNGAGIEPTAKMLALIEHGLLDVATGPDPWVAQAAAGFRIRGRWTGSDRNVPRIIKAHLGPFNAANPADPLYPNLLRRGLVRQWSNPGHASTPFLPGGLYLSDLHHPINSAGIEDTRLTFFGTPAEGMRLFPSAAARPQCQSDVFTSLSVWAQRCLLASTPMSTT